MSFVCAQSVAGEVPVNHAVGQQEAEKIEKSDSKDLSFVVMPIPLSNPSVGTGLILPAVLFYEPKGSARPWMTGAGALATDNGSKALGVFQKAYLGGDRFRVSGGLGRADLNLRFYGIGGGDASRDRSLKIEQDVDFAQAQGLMRLSTHQYFGLRLRSVSVKTSIPISSDKYPQIPTPERDMHLVGPGLVYQYDTRDDELAPTKGTYANAALQWNLPGWGSDRDYQHFYGAINSYHEFGPNGILATRFAACDVSRNAPFFDLCLFGANNDLRGYEAGKYRDSTLIAAQAEYRWHFSKRWGMVAFAGVGGVAPNFSDYRASSLLPAGGVGLRFMASTEYKVNVSVDYAVGRNSDALYFGIGEAF